MEPGEIDSAGWLQENYLSHLGGLFSANMTYLHTTLNWTVTLLVGGAIAVMIRSEFPDPLGFAALLLMLIVTGHFCVRTAKAYTNIIRWTTLERLLLKLVLEDDLDQRQLLMEALKRDVEKYHVRWVCPLSWQTLVYRVLVELGFGYFFVIVIGLTVFSMFNVCMQWWMWAGLFLTLVFLAGEYWLGGARSVYFREFAPPTGAPEGEREHEEE